MIISSFFFRGWLLTVGRRIGAASCGALLLLLLAPLAQSTLSSPLLSSSSSSALHCFSLCSFMIHHRSTKGLMNGDLVFLEIKWLYEYSEDSRSRKVLQGKRPKNPRTWENSSKLRNHRGGPLVLLLVLMAESDKGKVKKMEIFHDFSWLLPLGGAATKFFFHHRSRCFW